MKKQMTKREVMEMIKNFKDDDILVFIEEGFDRDGYPFNWVQNVTKIEKREKE